MLKPAGENPTAPSGQASPWAAVGRGVASGGRRIDKARERAYPGQEQAAVNEAVRAFRP